MHHALLIHALLDTFKCFTPLLRTNTGMVNSNTLDNILNMLKNHNVLKGWTIYNDKYNGDVVVRVRFGGQYGEAGTELCEGSFKRNGSVS